ncbi:MAG: diguanylate cyclase [Halanaerobium sp.]
MKTQVFLREEQKYKEIAITDSTKPEINDKLLSKWENIINVMAEIIEVSAALIMKVNQDSIRVFLKNQNKDNPYKIGFSDSLGQGLFCETVIAKNKVLYIKNALKNDVWKDNPHIDLDMISYYGLPLNWSDGESFGTICILNNDIIDLNQKRKNLLKLFRNQIEEDLNSLLRKRKLNNFFDINLDLLCIANMEGDFVKVNSAWEDLLGYSKAKLEGMNFLDFLHPDDIKLTRKVIEQLKANKKITKFVNRFEDEKGDYHYLEWNSKATKKYFYAAARDITKRKKNEYKIKKQKKKLDWIIEGTNTGIWEWNIETGKTVFNKKWAEMIGYELEELEPTTVETWEDLTHPVDLQNSKKELKKYFNGNLDFYSSEMRMKHKEGHWVWVLDKGKVISWNDDGQPHKMLGLHIDISKQKRYEQIIKELNKVAIEFQELANGKEICQQTIAKAREILDFDLSYIGLLKDGKFVLTAASEKIDAETLPLEYGMIGKAFKNNESNLTLDTEKDPEAKPLDREYKSGITVPMQDIGVFQVIAAEKNSFNWRDLELAEILIASTKAALEKLYYEKELEYKSFYDSLTNLYNRRFFEEEMQRLNTKRQLPLSIIMADLNGLKIINDSFGHAKGDELLVKTAEILKETLREEDIIARHGGDEFAVLMPETAREELEKIINRIKEKIQLINTNKKIPLSLAIGGAIKNNSAEDINEVLSKADNQMYQNKLSESRNSKRKIVQGLLNILDAKSPETKEHASRMSNLALDFGEKLGLSISELNRLSLLANFHDIGKANISEKILNKKDQLTKEEWQLLQGHSEKGYKIAISSEEFAVIADEIYAHHENWDGSGYPRALSGEDIPYLARIISIIDAYEVMTHNRPYGEAISKKEALAEIKNSAGSQFDPALVEEFIEMMRN